MPQHEAREDEGVVPSDGLRRPRVVLGQPPKARGPREAALHDPSHGQQHESAPRLRQLHDGELYAALRGVRGRLLPDVAIVHVAEAHGVAGRLVQLPGQPCHPRAVLFAGRVEAQPAQQSQRVHRRMQLGSVAPRGAVETGSDGRVEIEEATFGGKWWKVSALGYITDLPSSRPDGSPGNPHEFRLYREPKPEIVVVIPTGYVGPVFVDFIPSNAWIQDAPGSRRFRFESSANGYVPIIASPLLRRATWATRAEYRDGTPIARAGDASDRELAFRLVGWCDPECRRILYVVGTSADEKAFEQLVFANDSSGARNWDHAAAARVFSEAKQSSERTDVVPANSATAMPR